MVRGPRSFVIVGVLSLAAVAAFVSGPSLFADLVPRYAPDDPTPPEETAPQADGSAPGHHLADGAEGLVATGPIAALAGNFPVFVRDVLSGHRTDVAGDIPSEIMTIRPILGCIPTPPLPGSAVVHVVAGPGGLPTALSSYDDSVLAAAVQALADTYRATGEVVVPPPPVHAAHDVAVTETRAPVYLVLETAPGLRLWNLHLAEGARIERVVLLGGDQAGVANLDPVVPVEVILADGLRACAIDPAYPRNPGHPDAVAARSGDTAAQARIDALATRAAAYDDWFRATFGVTASASRAGFDRGDVSVAGPAPGAADPKAVYAPIDSSRIRTTQGRIFEVRGQTAKGEGFADRVRAIATGFAFGDLAWLRQGVQF